MAACADSCITSPNWPVMVSLPLPSTIATSVLRIEPPTSVHASPVTRPTSLFSLASVSRNLVTPRNSLTFSAVESAVYCRRFLPLCAPPCGRCCRFRAPGCERRLRACSERMISRRASSLNVELLFGQAGGFALLAHQELLGDLNFFHLGVAMQPQDFHAVLQRGGNGVQHVGRGNEEYL